MFYRTTVLIMAQTFDTVKSKLEQMFDFTRTTRYAGHDVSETVDELIALNNLESGSLQAGQRIIVPVE